MSVTEAMDAINKQFGKGSAFYLGGNDTLDVERVAIGIPSIDAALGGGFPKGRIIEIIGMESGGKTTLTLHLIAAVQKLGGHAAFIDAEHSLDPKYARALGVDTDTLMISQPDHGEQALEIADALLKAGGIDIIVIDSVAALVPKSELEGDMGTPQMGVMGRMMSQALRKLTGNISKSNCIFVFVNQIRMKIGVMFGNPETTSGGNALKFYASQRLDIRRIQTIKDGDEVIGSRTRLKVIKNKVSPPHREAEFDILYGQGISRESDLIDFAVERGVVIKSGSWYSYGQERLAQGKEQTRQLLKENPTTFDSILEAVQKMDKEKP